MKEYYVNSAQWSVYYTREDGQARLADKCSSPSEAEAIKEALQKTGAQNVFVTQKIDIEVIPS